MKIVKDGDKYCVQKGNFKNLQESKDYFFIDKKELDEFRNEEYDKAYLETLHDQVDDYMQSCGVNDHSILHEQIDNPKERDWIYEGFMEWVSG